MSLIQSNTLFAFLRVNRLISLPRGLGTASGLEILDLTYNNLQKESLPGNFSVMSKWKCVIPENIHTPPPEAIFGLNPHPFGNSSQGSYIPL